MTLQSGSQSKSNWGKWLVAALVIVYFAMNALHLGSDNFINSINSNISSLLSVCIAVMAVILWYKVGKKSKNKLVWLGFTIGWTLWAVAESWWAIAQNFSQELPYPSGADIFWLIGYIPMYIALWERNRTIPFNANRVQKLLIASSIILSIGITTVYVLMPILADSDANTVIENFLNIAYPAADLFLLILILRIFFNYQQGSYGRVWFWLSIGFVFESISDLVYSYASTVNLYYPNGTANFISTVAVDFPYNLSYLFILIGFIVMHAMQRKHQVILEDNIVLKEIPNTHVLIFLGATGLVEEASQNFEQIFSRNLVQGQALEKVIGLQPAAVVKLLDQIKADKFSSEKEVNIQIPAGLQRAWLSGEAVTSPEGSFLGAILLLRFFSSEFSNDQALSDYHKGIIRALLKRSGIQEVEEVRKLIFNYYLTHLRPLYNILINEGGSIMADNFLSRIQSEARKKGWIVHISPKTMIDINDIPAAEASTILPSLYVISRKIASEITDEETVNREIEKVSSGIDPKVKNCVQQLTGGKE
jgi:hypothetical protein